MRQPLLCVVLFVLSCNAICVWLRTTGDSGLAWCVDESSGDEGYFEYELDARISRKLNTIQLHQWINAEYRDHQNHQNRHNRPGIVDRVSQSQNWSMVALDFFNSALGAVSGVGQAVMEGRRKTFGENDLPLSQCFSWHPQNGDCMVRTDRGALHMSEQQKSAITEECQAICARHAMHFKWDFRDESLAQRGCCDCDIGEDHGPEDDSITHWTMIPPAQSDQ